MASRMPQPSDGTLPLLKGGVWTLAVGIVSAAATKFVFGGIGDHGPHTNAGWLFLILAMMCLPFGTMIFVLGGLKWLRNRRLGRG